MKPLTVRAHISPSQPHSASSVRCREGACVPRAVLDSFWPSDPVIAALPLWQRERATVGLHVCGEGWKGYFISYRQTGSNYSNLQMQLSEVAREKRGEEPTARKEEREKEKNLWIQLSAGGAERSRAAGWASNAVTGRVLPCKATVSGGSRSSNHTHTHTLLLQREGRCFFTRQRLSLRASLALLSLHVYVMLHTLKNGCSIASLWKPPFGTFVFKSVRTCGS